MSTQNGIIDPTRMRRLHRADEAEELRRIDEEISALRKAIAANPDESWNRVLGNMIEVRLVRRAELRPQMRFVPADDLLQELREPNGTC